MSRIQLQCVLVVCLVSSVLAIYENSWFGPEFTILQRVYNDCRVKDDFTGCLKLKALNVVSRAMHQDVIRVMDGISFEKQNTTASESILDPTEQRALNDLPRLDRNLLTKLDKFLRTHLLIVDLGEGRGKDKDKKIYKYIVAAIITGMSIVGPIGLKTLALIAGKALIISKVALTIAGIIALKKIFGSEHQEDSNVQVHADHNRRNALLMRPAKPGQQSNDPYRYYYEYPSQ